MIILITAVIFPLIAIACGIWISTAMVSYIAEIQRDIKTHCEKQV